MGWIELSRMGAEILSHENVTGKQCALMGEVIAAYCEINHILACTKGGVLERAEWVRIADELDRHTARFRSAWQEFKTAPIVDENGLVWVDRRVTRGFQEAAEGLRTLLTEARAVDEELGVSRWNEIS
ncbi:hypothetical protein ACFQ9X_07505 [Catenulispora yoronensis]